MQIDDDVNDDVNDDDRKERQRDRERRAVGGRMRMCGDLFSLITDERCGGVFLSLSLFVPVLCGVEDFCFARVVVSSPKSVVAKSFPFFIVFLPRMKKFKNLDFETLYDLLKKKKKKKREREESKR